MGCCTYSKSIFKYTVILFCVCIKPLTTPHIPLFPYDCTQLSDWWMQSAYLDSRMPVAMYTSPGVVLPRMHFQDRQGQIRWVTIVAFICTIRHNQANLSIEDNMYLKYITIIVYFKYITIVQNTTKSLGSVK